MNWIDWQPSKHDIFVFSLLLSLVPSKNTNNDMITRWCLLEWNFDCGIEDLIHRELNVFLFSSSTQHKFNTNVARKVALVRLFIIQRNIFNSAKGSRSWPCRNWFFFDTFIDVSISVLSYKHSSNRFSSRAYFKSLATTLSPFLSSR